MRCRQARWRFTSAVGASVAPSSRCEPLRLAYADPPYPGKAGLYRGHRDYAGEVDHVELIERLSRFDGWALSTSAEALPTVLALCPPGTCVAAWVKYERPNRRAQRPQNGWEPVLYSGGRLIEASDGSPRRVDYLVHGIAPRTTDPERVIGAKPAQFARFVFDLLGAQAGDAFADLFPGSGGMTRAWDVYTSSPPAAATRSGPPAIADAYALATADAS